MTAPCALTFPTDRQFVLGVIGDSITGRGSFASDPTKDWVSLLATRIGAQCPQGVTRIDCTSHHDAQGSTCLGTIDTYPTSCDLVLVGLGTNDCRETNADGTWVYSQTNTYTAAETVYSSVAAQNPGAVIVGVGVWNTSLLAWPPTAGSRLVRWDALIGERCAENGGIYIPIADLYDYSPNRLPTGVTAFGGYTTDGFHPNDAGHAAIYNRVANWLRLP